eukprot:gene45028-60117_t
MGNLCTKITGYQQDSSSKTCDPNRPLNESKLNHVESDEKIPAQVISNKVCFGAGCYWGTEKYFRHNFQSLFPGSIIKGMVGFMGPKDAPDNPSYKDVCSGSTGHVEVYFVEFQGGAEMFEKLVRFFFRFHDPTTLNKQGNDKGSQYSSVIYCYDDEQMKIADKVKKELQLMVDK